MDDGLSYVPSASKVAIRLRSETDGLDFECAAGESVLDAALRAGLPMAHACGGKARCSTCRIWLIDPGARLPGKTEPEAALTSRLALDPKIRLACQLRPNGALRFRRLVLDADDLAVANQLDRRKPVRSGEIRNVAVLFFDVAQFTAMSQRMPPYDVMFLLNKFLTNAARILERFGGFFDKSIGDGFMAVFGVRGGAHCALRSVGAALDVLKAVDRAKPVMKDLYGVDFDARIGLHYGEALVGALGPAGEERLTVIGDVANIASRVEQANKEAGTRLLITEDLYAVTKNLIETPDFVRTRIAGVGRRTLYEVSGLTEKGSDLLAAVQGDRWTGELDSRWVRLLRSEDLPEGEVRIAPQARFDVALTRRDGRVYAFNNHCPHNRLPFFGCEITEDSGLPPTPADSQFKTSPCQVVCRFHGSVFGLDDGRIEKWCPELCPDGSPPGLPELGDISKNEAPLEVFRVREIEGEIWAEIYPADW